MYKFSLPSEMVKSLYNIKTYMSGGSIIGQIRDAVALYLKGQEDKIGCPVEDIKEAIDRHEAEKDNQEEEYPGPDTDLLK